MALYPPIVASSMPAFDIGKNKVRIYYNLSSYNVARIDDISRVHVTIRRQSSNVNVVNNSYEILQKPFPGERDDIDIALNRYYVEINSSEIIKERKYQEETQEEQIETGFQQNGIYKVQLRFSTKAKGISESEERNFYTNNIENFSQWSTVCIIKAISAPEFYIDDFYTGTAPEETDINYFYSTLSDFIGVYKQKDSLQTLKKWRIRLLSNSYTKEDILNIDNYTLSDSGEVLNQATNYNLQDGSVVFSCSLPYQLTNETSYKLFFEIQTRNGYYNSLLYNFTCSQSDVNTLSGSFESYINEEQGYIKLVFKSSQVDMKNLVLRRTDSKSNFLKWEDLKFFEARNDFNFTYYDFTAESGEFYRYLVQKVDARGRRGTPVYDQSKSKGTGIMAEWEHPFLLQITGNGDVSGTKQLKLKYDFNISSYKTNISQSKTDTIGSKYPFIRRNGTMYYRSFPITGTITQFMDQADLFTNSDTLFKGYYNKYQDFKGQIGEHGIQYDYTYQRKFREKVEEFLYNSKPKLYKSMQQGNIFIKLMQVSLTPKNELGRLVYTFSATAYQIDEACINTYNNYNLITVGTFNPHISDTKTVLKQLSSYDFNENIEGNLFKAGQDIIGADSASAASNSIAKSIKYGETFNGTKVTDFTINWLRLTIESEPYLILEQAGKYRAFDDVIPSYTTNNPDYVDKNIVRNNITESIRDNNYQDTIKGEINYPLYQIESTYGTNNIYLGWLFTIKDGTGTNNEGKQIIISPPNNIYELNEEDFSYKKEVQIIPAKDVAMLVDFRLMETIEQDITLVPKSRRFNKVNGQLVGTYDENTQLISRINYKYKYTYNTDNDNIKRTVNGIKNILVDTEPGAIIYLKTSAMDNPGRFVVNANGEFSFDFSDISDNPLSIQSLKIVGINILHSQTVDKGSVSDFSEISDPEDGYLCEKDNNLYCYYRGVWYPAERQQAQFVQNEYSIDIFCPVDAMVFYFANVEEDIY